MTPQGNFMILAPIVPSREAELRGLLNSMNEAPGWVNPNNPLVPFAQFDTLHFARFVILDDKNVGDLRIYGLPVRNYPLYLAFLGDIDGEEEVFLNENPQSTLKLGQARGAAICGTADANAEVFEYATRQIKQAVVGSGSAEKAQVQLMMKSILKLDGPLSPDAADALAAAVCHALRGRVRVSVQRAASRG